jgi:3-oxoacyl-[acyl-carrier protein] reductase
MRKIVLTGASGGLGLVIAENLLNEGYFVHLIGNKNTSKLKVLHSKFPSTSKVYTIDFLQKSNFLELVNEIGEVDGLVHALGVSSAGMSWKITPDEWNRVLHLNLTVPFQLTQAFTPQLRANKFGRIIFFSSVVAQKGFVGTSAYSTSKSALIGLTRALAVELINSGVTVNCIAPGYMDKGMIDEVTDEYLKEILALIPSKTLGDAINIACSHSFIFIE